MCDTMGYVLKIACEKRKRLHSEFVDFQGDAERAQGSEPIPMMDRKKIQEQPTSQVSVTTHIQPCANV